MSACNQCGGRMVPCATAIVPALECENCGRLIPKSAQRSTGVDRRLEKKALRAARRMKRRNES